MAAVARRRASTSSPTGARQQCVGRRPSGMKPPLGEVLRQRPEDAHRARPTGLGSLDGAERDDALDDSVRSRTCVHRRASASPGRRPAYARTDTSVASRMRPQASNTNRIASTRSGPSGTNRPGRQTGKRGRLARAKEDVLDRHGLSAPEEGKARELAPARPVRAPARQSRNLYPPGTSEQGARRTRTEKALQTREADGRTRTGDPFITSEVLYQLSYVGQIPASSIAGCLSGAV
jgi:hypothetical protein